VIKAKGNRSEKEGKKLLLFYPLLILAPSEQDGSEGCEDSIVESREE
jgi:hypothetical protein